jgi:hypothetical protein
VPCLRGASLSVRELFPVGSTRSGDYVEALLDERGIAVLLDTDRRLLAIDADAMEQGNLPELLTRKRLGESRCMPP